jgi:hypothetical protein
MITETADPVVRVPHHLRDLDQLPAVLSAEELALLLRIGRSHFYKQAKRGVFDFLQVKPVIGPKSYSGVLVSRWLKGESVYAPSFGRKRA